MIIILLLFLATVIWYYLQYYRKWRSKFGDINELPGPRNFPLIGNVWRVIFVPRLERVKYVQKLIDNHGRLFRMWLGTEPMVVIANAEDAQIILSSRTNIEKSRGYSFLIPWLKTGLLTSGGSKWHQRRKLLTPAFHFSILESFLPVMAEHSRTFVDQLKPLEDRTEDWNIFPFIHKFTLDVICETAMGVHMNIQKGETSEYLQSVSVMSHIILEKILKPWWHNKYLYSYSNLSKKEENTLRILHTMSMDVIQKNKEKRQKGSTRANSAHLDDDDEYNSKKRKAFLDLLLDEAELSKIHLSDEDIREEVDTFMFEGHDTTTSGICSTVHLLSLHPEIQEKVARELFSVFGDSDREPTLHDISELKYLECVIKESHRLLPPVPIISRTLTEEIILGGKYRIPPGTLIESNIFQIQRDEKHFPNPDEFNPDRFAPENIRTRHPFAFIPFSAGPRNCIGQKFAILEEKILVSSLLRKYKIESSQQMEDAGIFFELVIRHENGVRVTIKPRTWKT